MTLEYPRRVEITQPPSGSLIKPSQKGHKALPGLLLLVVFCHPVLKNVCKSSWIISPGRGENKKELKPPPGVTLRRLLENLDSPNASNSASCLNPADLFRKAFFHKGVTLRMAINRK